MSLSLRSPVVAETTAELRRLRAELPGPVVLVPTMGALHEGHRTLVRAAREHGGSVVVSVFVNPTQFGPGEDFDRYPRTWDADLAALAEEGTDLVFHPPVDEVYPPGALGVTVQAGPLGEVLEGAVRPGHFAGVLTVVAKLFGLVRPDVAVFGEKDYQQLTLIRAMARELALGVQVVGVPTVREDDGMALSSRNRFLSAEQRRAAAALSAALRAGVQAGPQGAGAVLAAAGAVLAEAPDLLQDYLELTDPDLGPAPAAGPARLLVAARAGSTRLIDNTAVELGNC
ncbi:MULTISPECIES: pantoate--beta-alanine ligase [unclassified Modestobacter]|uniref:pantoate--beta-alanine ligase n=1 Tax=unclassified Modestobacter TaxID=2643866 RepID=UPI0022AB182A|nr:MULTISPECIES: pantoate--beta-alanine ligase [unclassified Modestobacter]MCZ2825335.1 pantoate--beta-alanine ligase [Modestobacter sp. VKM Ac-2981]MCZ2853600.1 pantoate--beta-alanine ligase [Modestobacter sp. VKM Ac-2982]